MTSKSNSLEERLKEKNGRFVGIKNMKLYFTSTSKLRQSIEEEIMQIIPQGDSPEELREFYLDVQCIMDKYLRGIDAGRNVTFTGLSAGAWGYYGVGLASRVSDFSQISLFKQIYNTPVIKEIAQAGEGVFHFLADKTAFAFPHYDKAGHFGMGLLIGRGVEAVTDKAIEKVFKGHDVDNIANEKNEALVMHTVTQTGATGAWAIKKELLDDLLGGVKCIKDIGATMGGQAANVVMSVTRARKYSVVIDVGRQALFEAGMDHDGNILSPKAGFQELYVPFSKPGLLRHSLEHDKKWTKYLRPKK